MPPDKKPFPEPRYGSKRLKRLVLKATSYHPGERFESPQAMLRELQQCDEYKQFIEQSDNDSQETVSFFSEEGRASARVHSGATKSVEKMAVREIYAPAQKPLPKQTVVIFSAVAAVLLTALLSAGLWFGLGSDADSAADSSGSAQTEKIIINEQPESVITKPNKQVVFRVVASGTGLQYQWYYKKKNGASWSLWRVYSTDEIKPPANSTWDGMQVRCQVTDNEGNSVYSQAASVTLVPYEAGDFQITKQPKSYAVRKSDLGKKSLSFSVKANGKDMKYQWYFCKEGETAWTLWDERTSSSFKAKPNDSWNKILIYCRVTNYNAEELYSDIASVTISDD